MALTYRRFGLPLMLIVAQVGCVGMGFWLHHYLVVSALSQSTQQEALAELAADAKELLPAIERLDLQTDLAEPAGRRQLDRLLRAQGAVRGLQWTLVDSRWQILPTAETADVDAAADETAAQTLAWSPFPDDFCSQADWMPGSFVMGDGPHVALGRRLSGGDGYAIVHRPLGSARVAPAVLSRSLPGAGAVAWCWTSVLVGLAGYLTLTKFSEDLTRKAARNETAALKSVYSLVRTRDAVIFGLAKLSESRDETTGHHLERIAAYASRLAASVRHHPKYCHVLTPEFIELIGISSALHDIGKVGIEDAILLKPGRFTEEEWTRMKEHSTIGGECLLEIERHLGSSNFLQMAREIAISHHERWDGTGYPQGLAGEQIPLAARIVAIADVYDALSTRRPYKEPMPHKECVALIRDGANSQFDPDLVEAFLNIESWFRQIARQYAHNPSDNTPSAPEGPDPSSHWQQQALVKLEAVLQSNSAAATSPSEFG